MDQLRRMLVLVQEQLSRLSPNQKLLIGSLVVIAGMSLFLVSQYAGQPDRAVLISGETPEYQTRVVSFLEERGISATALEGRVMVPAEMKYRALGLLGDSRMLPADAGEVLFGNILEKQSWMQTSQQNDAMMSIARMNELARVMANFPSIDRAKVFISDPRQDRRNGIGRANIAATAQVTAFPAGGGLSQKTVDALAAMVVGSTAGLRVENVQIIDGTTGVVRHASAEDEFASGNYIETVRSQERHVRSKIQGLLQHIPNVIVAVNAMVDPTAKETSEIVYKKNGDGTVSVPSAERSESTEQRNAAIAYEPGVRSNTGDDLAGGGSSEGPSLTTKSEDIENETRFGQMTTTSRQAMGVPTQINVAVNVPREYVSSAAQGGAEGEEAPDGPAITDYWTSTLQPELRALIEPLVTTAGGESQVVVSMMPVALASTPGGVDSSGATAGMMSTVVNSGLIDRVVVGALAVLAVGAMVLTVRKAGKSVELPTADEIVGLPPALQGDGDIVGEVTESDAPMLGIELGDEEMNARRMLEEITELVDKSPSDAAAVLNRWINSAT